MKEQIIAMGIMTVLIISSIGFITGISEKTKPENITSKNINQFPNANWLMIWQDPNDTENYPLVNLPGEFAVTPTMTMNYWGTNVFWVFNPSGGYGGAGKFNYTWEQLNNYSIFPQNSQLWISCESTEMALEVHNHSLTDNRIKATWWNDYQTGTVSPAYMKLVHDILSPLPIYLLVCIDIQGVGTPDNPRAYYDQTPYSWANYSPYYDGLAFNCLPRLYDISHYNAMSYYSAIKDLHSMTPGKDIVVEIMNWHYDAGVFNWDDYAQIMASSARLHQEGIVSKVSLLGAYWVQWLPITSNYMRNFLVTEFGNHFSSTINLNTNTATTILNGISRATTVLDLTEISQDNWTFYSQHTQTIITNQHNMAFKNLKTGEMQEFNDSFVAEVGISYQIFYWPHTFIHYTNDIYINSTTSWNNKDILIDGMLYVNNNFYANNTRIQFGTNHYIDSNYNATHPAFGMTVKYESNLYLIWENTTIQPLLNEFPYQIGIWKSNDYTKHIWLTNCSFNGYENSLGFNGYVRVIDTIFGAYYWNRFDGGVSDGMFINCYGGNYYQIWKRNTFWNDAKWSTLPVYILAGNAYFNPDFGTFTFEDNKIVGGLHNNSTGQALRVDVELTSDSGYTVLKNLQVYREDFPFIYDGKTPDYNSFPPGYINNELYAYEHGNNRIYFTNEGYGWFNITTNITTEIKIYTPISLSGTLKDANNTVIGSYSSVNGLINQKNIMDVWLTAGGHINSHPWPWTFTITSALDSQYYWGVSSYGTLGVNSTCRFDPYLIQITNKSFSFYPEDSLYLHIVQYPKKIFMGVPTTIYNDNTIDMGNNLMAWSREKYTLPEQINMQINQHSGTIKINVTHFDNSLVHFSFNDTVNENINFTLQLGQMKYYLLNINNSTSIISSNNAGTTIFMVNVTSGNHTITLTLIGTNIHNSPAYTILIIMIIIGIISIGMIIFIETRKQPILDGILAIIISLIIVGTILVSAIVLIG